MTAFWIVAALMTGAALAFVLVPLLRRPVPGRSSRDAASLEVLREARRDIDADIARGLLPEGSRDEAIAELVTRAESDLAARETPPGDTRRPWIVSAVAAVALIAVAFGFYGALGSPRSIGAPGAAPMDDRQIVAMVENLARKVKERPDSIEGWALLARSMNALGRYPEAVEAYAHLAKLVPGDADVLADYADALAMSQGRDLAGRPYELVKEALRIDPRHGKSLALAGTAALNEGDFAAATRYWQALAATLPPESEDVPRIASILQEVRERAAAAGKPLDGKPGPLAQAPKAAAAAAGSVSGEVSLDPALASRVGSTDTLFIFARAEGGPRVPLAIVRGSAQGLPRAFTLDDSMAMAPGMQLSGATAVRVEARISKSGNATPQAGDLSGASAVVKPGARGVKVVIDTVVKAQP